MVMNGWMDARMDERGMDGGMDRQEEYSTITPDHPFSKKPFSQLLGEIKKREMTRMRTQTTRLTPLRALVTPTDFLTPDARIAVIVSAMKKARMSG